MPSCLQHPVGSQGVLWGWEGPHKRREDQQVRIARGHAGNWLQGGRKVFQVADLPEQRGVSEEEGAAESHKRGEEESGRIGVGARGRARRLGLAPVV